MKKLRLISVIMAGLVILSLSVHAQNSIDEISYAAYLKSSTTLWEKAIDIQTKNLEKENSTQNRYQLAMAYYGLLNATMATQDEDTFSKYLDKTKDLLTEVIEADESMGEPRAIYSSVLGLEMAYSPMKGMYLGYKSNSYMSKAMELSPESPLVIKLYAGSKLYTPSMFGGDKDAAREHFDKAVELYEQNEKELTYNWLYLDALAHLGISYTQTGDKANAEIIFRKAIEKEPEFYWVSKSLLPELLASK